MDYRHHVTGFFLLSLVSAPIITGLGWWLWRGRRDITLLVIGALQAILGLIIYLERFRIAGM